MNFSWKDLKYNRIIIPLVLLVIVAAILFTPEEEVEDEPVTVVILDPPARVYIDGDSVEITGRIPFSKSDMGFYTAKTRDELQKYMDPKVIISSNLSDDFLGSRSLKGTLAMYFAYVKIQSINNTMIAAQTAATDLSESFLKSHTQGFPVAFYQLDPISNDWRITKPTYNMRITMILNQTPPSRLKEVLKNETPESLLAEIR